MPSNFPQRVRELRKKKQLSQRQLAELVGVHYTHISRYERGESARPAADTLKRLADVLGVTTDYLLEGTTRDIAHARLEDRDLLRQFQQVEQLSEDDKYVIKRVIDAFLTQKKVQDLAAEHCEKPVDRGTHEQHVTEHLTEPLEKTPPDM